MHSLEEPTYVPGIAHQSLKENTCIHHETGLGCKCRQMPVLPHNPQVIAYPRCLVRLGSITNMDRK